MPTRSEQQAHHECREAVGRAGGARDAGRRRSDGQGRLRAALATDQPQEGRSATDGPDIARVREAAFVCETCLHLPEMEVATGHPWLDPRPARHAADLAYHFCITQRRARRPRARQPLCLMKRLEFATAQEVCLDSFFRGASADLAVK